jgi:hypothetical protein
MLGEIGKAAVGVFIAGSVATLGLAGLLLIAGDPWEAAEVIWISPFPCPTFLPC